MSIVASGLDVRNVPLGDATVLGISWENDGKDFHIRLELGSNYRDYPRIVTLVAGWATHVIIDLDYGTTRMGSPFTQAFDLSTGEHGTYHAHFDFGGHPNGSISFQCNEISICT